MKQDDWDTLRKLTDPDGDSIEFEIGNDNDRVDVTIKQGPHEVCCLVLTGAQLDELIDRLQRVRKWVK